jgi:hypothetical protein
MIYQSVIDDVLKNIRKAVFDEGYDDHFLKELKTVNLFLFKFNNYV